MMNPGDLIGRILNGYRLERSLGSGTFGTVYLARHTDLDRLRAIKVAREARFVELVRAEGRLLDALQHPNVVRLYEMDTTADPAYVNLEYVPGGDLRKALADARMPPQAALELALQLLKGLSAAHELGILHRDIKPSNILLGEEGVVKLADFGLGRVAAQESLLVSGRSGSYGGSQLRQSQRSEGESRSSEIVGTIAYMSPEQRRGEELDERSDLYSLGAVLYEALTHRLPEGRFKLPGELLEGVPSELDGLLDVLLAPEADGRPASAQQAHSVLSEAARARQQGEQRAREAEEQRAREAAAATARREREAREARERQAAQEKRERAAHERRQREAAAAQARREREAREAEEARRRELEEQQRREAERVARQGERERATADRGASRVPVLALLRDKRLHIAVAVVVVLVVGALLSSVLKRRVEERRALLSPDTRAGEETTGPDGGTYVWVPAGEFMMGSADGRDNEKPVHKVQITKGFWLGKHEVTNAQYAVFLNAYGSNEDSAGHELLEIDSNYCEIEERGGRYEAKSGRERHPAVEVSWYGAAEYCKHHGLRLPTEAEWEYGARGPEGLKYPWGDEWDSEKCCNDENRKAYSGAETFPVGSFPSGASWCGALDMAGNVWEWCSDWYGAHYCKSSPPSDPLGASSGEYRVLRGGGWDYCAHLCRSANRNRVTPSYRYNYNGFRPVVASPR